MFYLRIDGNKMYLYGGYSGSQRLADMHAYDFETNAWSQVDANLGEVPSGRSSLVAQVYENNLYIFGGYNGSTVLNDFYKFRLKPIGVPPTGLVNDFMRLLNDPDMSDVCFLVEDKKVYAHRAILAIRSEYFRALLFNGHMRESVDSLERSSLTPITLMDVSHTVFVKVLEYLYTDNIRDVNLELGIHLLIASEQFMLDRLKFLCEDIIRRDINVHNVINILVTSHQHHALGLKEIALDFILTNLTAKEIQKGLSVSETILGTLVVYFFLWLLTCLLSFQDLKAEPDLLVEIIKLSSAAAPVLQTGPSQGVIGSLLRQPQPLEPQQAAFQQVQQQVNMMDPVFHQNSLHRNGPFGPDGAGAWGARR